MKTIRLVSDKCSLHCASLNNDNEENQFAFLSYLLNRRKKSTFVYDKNDQCMNMHEYANSMHVWRFLDRIVKNRRLVINDDLNRT